MDKQLDNVIIEPSSSHWQCRLLQAALAGWPRRDSPLLFVNCGSGAFLPFLWQAGFDLIATEADCELRSKASMRQIPNLAVYGSDDSELPFEDDSFDWVIVELGFQACRRLDKTAREALRVSRRGLMFIFWNRSSLPLLFWRVFHGKSWPLAAAPWRKVWQALRKLDAGKMSGFTILHGPVWSWSGAWLFDWMNGQISTFPVGAWAAIRLDFSPGAPFTSLPLHIDPALQNMEKLMNWAHKRMKHINPEDKQ